MATIGELKPDPRNARKHTPRNVDMIATSMQETGFGRSILLANDGTILAGNATVEAAGQIGLEDMLVIETDGTKVIALKRTDLAPGSEMATRLALFDNRTSELADWDESVIADLNEAMDLSAFFFEHELGAILGSFDLGSLDAPETDGANPYSIDTPSPIYAPTGERPDTAELTDQHRRDDLIADIRDATIPDDIRDFLMMAAQRHVVFDYRKIAEFYAHADAETQRLMEESALVIIDFDRAIELGYVRLTSRLADLIEDEDDGDE